MDWELSTLVPLYKGKGDPLDNKVNAAWNEGIGKGVGEEDKEESED